MAKTPLEVVNEQHGGKEKLVDKVLGVLEQGDDEDRDDLRRRLLSASNKKLLRLLRIGETIRQRYGSTERLAQTVAQALGRAKDSDYVKRLSGFTPARLLDLAETLARRAGRLPAGAEAPRAEAKKPTRAKAAAPKEEKPAKKAPATKQAEGQAAKPAARKPARKK